ncbi:MAG TPA: 2-methylcitrate dehydratase, partial [Micropepsaceae bacterium]
QFTRDYLDPEKRSIANGIIVRFADGTILPEAAIEYPIGHRRRRTEGIPLLVEKFRTNLARRFTSERQQIILDASLDGARLDAMNVNDYVDLYII